MSDEYARGNESYERIAAETNPSEVLLETRNEREVTPW